MSQWVLQTTLWERLAESEVNLMSDPEYLLDNRVAAAGRRFEALSALFDDATFRILDRLGLGPGWRCWEVGAGGATVPRGLAERVGDGGRVLATDIDPSWAAGAAGDGVEVKAHELGRDPVPEGEFDLVHARLVLVHVRERDRALAELGRALRPGGWLVIEDADPALMPLACPDEVGPDQERANRLRTGFRRLLAERGACLSYGRTLPRRLRDIGLVEVAAEAAFPLARPESAVLEAATIEHVRQGLIEAGLATAEEIEQHRAALAAGRLDIATAPMISAWGRRPPASGT